MKFFSHYDRPEPDHEICGGEKVVQDAGYRPLGKMIKEAIDAGDRLQFFRESLYGSQDENEYEDLVEDPTARPGFDLADASHLLQTLERKAADALAAASKLKEAAEAAKVVQDKETGGT